MRQLVFAACVFAALLGCSDREPTQPDATASASATGTFSALLDGAPFKSDSGKASGTASSSGRFQVIAYDSSRANPITVSLSLFNISEAGIYPLGVGESAIGGFVDLSVGGLKYHQFGTGNGGAIVLTHVTATRLTGKFFMNFLYPTEFGPAGSNVALTEASFDVPIIANGSIAVPENRGSWAVGTVGPKSWRSAIFEASKGADGFFGVRTGNFDYEISLGFRNITGPGTYQLGPAGAGGIGARTQQYDWALLAGQEAGTMIITSISASRVMGSVSAVLYPVVGSEHAGVLPVRISFDIGLAPPSAQFNAPNNR